MLIRILICLCAQALLSVSTTEAQYIDFTPEGDWIKMEITEVVDSSKVLIEMMSIDSVVSFYLLIDDEMVKLSPYDNFKSIESIVVANDKSYFFAKDSSDQSFIFYYSNGQITDISPAGNFRTQYGARVMSDGTVVIGSEDLSSTDDYLIVLHDSHAEVISSSSVYTQLTIPSDPTEGIPSDRFYFAGTISSSDRLLLYYDIDYGLVETTFPCAYFQVLNNNPGDDNHLIICNPISANSPVAGIYRVVDSTFSKISIPQSGLSSIQVVAKLPNMGKVLFSLKDTSGAVTVATRATGNMWTSVSSKLPADLTSIASYHTYDNKYTLVAKTTTHWEVYNYDGIAFYNITPAQGPYTRYSNALSTSALLADIVLINELNEEYLYSINTFTPGLPATLLNPGQLPAIDINYRTNGLYQVSKLWDQNPQIIHQGLFQHVPFSGTIMPISDKGDVKTLSIGYNDKYVLLLELDTLNNKNVSIYDYSTITPLIIPAYDTLDISDLATFNERNMHILYTSDASANNDDNREDSNYDKRMYGYIDKLIDLSHPYLTQYSELYFISDYSNYKKDQVIATYITDPSMDQTHRLMSLIDAPQNIPCNADDKVYYNPSVVNNTSSMTGDIELYQARKNNYIGFQNQRAGQEYLFIAGQSSELLPNFEIANGSEIVIITEECTPTSN